MSADLALPQDWPALLALVGIGAVASAINAVAGGGSFLSFPLLVAFGVPSLQANATNAAALWPGSLGSALGFLNLLPKAGRHLRALLVPTLAGSLVGAALLLLLGQTVFDFAVPFLILGSALVLAYQKRIKSYVDRRHGELAPRAGMALQFLIAVYGGYFGAGMGFLMLASYALYIEGSLHELNAMKVWLGLLINFAAMVVFLGHGVVLFVSGGALAIGAVIGGFLSARLSQSLDPEMLRVAVAAYGFLTAGFFAWRAFGP